MDSANHFDIGSDNEFRNATLPNETNEESKFQILKMKFSHRIVIPPSQYEMPTDLPDTAEPTSINKDTIASNGN